MKSPRVVEPGRPAYHCWSRPSGPRSSCRQVARGCPPSIAGGWRRASLLTLPRAQLNAITHPEIGSESARRMQEALSAGSALVVYEATLLVENQSYLGFDGLLVVDIPERRCSWPVPWPRLIKSKPRPGCAHADLAQGRDAQPPTGSSTIRATKRRCDRRSLPLSRACRRRHSAARTLAPATATRRCASSASRRSPAPG